MSYGVPDIYRNRNLWYLKININIMKLELTTSS